MYTYFKRRVLTWGSGRALLHDSLYCTILNFAFLYQNHLVSATHLRASGQVEFHHQPTGWSFQLLVKRDTCNQVCDQPHWSMLWPALPTHAAFSITPMCCLQTPQPPICVIQTRGNREWVVQELESLVGNFASFFWHQIEYRMLLWSRTNRVTVWMSLKTCFALVVLRNTIAPFEGSKLLRNNCDLPWPRRPMG